MKSSGTEQGGKIVVHPGQFRVEQASVADAGELLTLQRAAYVTEARLYDDPELPGLTQSLPELVDELRSAVALKAVSTAGSWGRSEPVLMARYCASDG